MNDYNNEENLKQWRQPHKIKTTSFFSHEQVLEELALLKMKSTLLLGRPQQMKMN